jgi:hypothetical protein
VFCFLHRSSKQFVCLANVENAIELAFRFEAFAEKQDWGHLLSNNLEGTTIGDRFDRTRGYVKTTFTSP